MVLCELEDFKSASIENYTYLYIGQGSMYLIFPAEIQRFLSEI